jgi:hypothetical protein
VYTDSRSAQFIRLVNKTCSHAFIVNVGTRPPISTRLRIGSTMQKEDTRLGEIRVFIGTQPGKTPNAL